MWKDESRESKGYKNRHNVSLKLTESAEFSTSQFNNKEANLYNQEKAFCATMLQNRSVIGAWTKNISYIV